MGMRQETINIAPGPDEIANIIRLIREQWASGNQVRAFELLCAGWPQMEMGQAIRLLKHEIELGEALTPYVR